jgi:hypothetical protein
MTVDSNGNVGIGTTSPSNPLQVNGNVSNYFVARFLHTKASQSYGIYAQTQDTGTDGAALYLTSNAGAKDLFYVRNDGNTGINTIAPARNLHVNDTMRLQPRSAAPSSAAEGDMYYDSDIHALCVYNSTAWVATAGSGTCA